MDKSLGVPATIGLSVPARAAATARKFGEWLKLQRGDRSLEQIAIKIRPLVRGTGLKVDQSLVYKIEQGRVPGWAMLGAFADVYGVPLPDLVQRLAASIEIPGAADLLRHDGARELLTTGGTPDAATTGGGHQPPTDLLNELAQAAFAFHALAVQCEEWSHRLTDIAAEHGIQILRRQTPDDRADATRRARTRGTLPRSTDRPDVDERKQA